MSEDPCILEQDSEEDDEQQEEEGQSDDSPATAYCIASNVITGDKARSSNNG